ncbi:NAD/NADP transhydrogenase alpha subunit [Paenibacillus oenotherae]|uniref:NAD/NADP transhydrogenase alpha subunit n=1 Tax=Paenibacillus oenotherae TaxID=1435645 RepID=A0ABS7D2F6_9BACL|nr:NAD/NADP transhydrogenase alpha subunit [Paenibacillus oenotherae]MBW7474125.1 NAD/NADP transhydrogenase alpha subunit [Paenibacillus oenotherae]
MKCISVYTRDFALFSDIYEQVMEAPPEENEEIIIEGVTVSGAGDVPDQYIERMRLKPEVVVMKEKERNIMILQHGEVFEICMPSDQSA